MSRTVKIILIISLIANIGVIYVASKAIEYRNHINHFLEKYQKVTQEFSAREVYTEENEALLKTPVSGKRIVFFGTQVIKNYDIRNYFPEYDAVNRGVVGQRVSGYLLRFKPDVLDLQPEKVVIEISSYNFRSYNTIEEICEYTELLTQLARYNQIEPICMAVIPPREEFKEVVDYKELGDYKVFDSVKIYNRWLAEFCSSNDIKLVDADRLLTDTGGYLDVRLSDNLIEPNSAGYEILTVAIKEQLNGINNQKAGKL